MKIINFIASAAALFATATPQLVNAQRIVSRTGGVRGLSNSDETKEMMGKIMNTIANMHPEGREGSNDIVERVLSNDKTMESIAKLKDALSSVDMSEMINTVVEHNNKHGRKLEIDQGDIIEFIGWLEETLGLVMRNIIPVVMAGVLVLFALVLFAIAPLLPETNDLGGRMLLTNEQGGSDMESMLEKAKDMLGSLDKDTDMNEVIESFMTNNKHGRELATFEGELGQGQIIEFIGWLEGQMELLGVTPGLLTFVLIIVWPILSIPVGGLLLIFLLAVLFSS